MMTSLHRIFLVSFVAASVAHAHSDHPANTMEGAPKPRPDRIFLTWTGDPATTQTVTWRTDTSVATALAELARASERPQRAELTVEGRTEHFEWDLGEMHYHTADFERLEPGTIYAYRVGDGETWSEWFHFRTASPRPEKFSFIYFGDAQNDIRTHWSRIAREAYRAAPQVAFTLHAGDLVNWGNSDWEWVEWFDGLGWVNGMTPIVATPGNHEYRALRSERQWTRKDGRRIGVTLHHTGMSAQQVGPRRSLLRVEWQGRTGEMLVDEDGTCLRADGGLSAITGFTNEELVGARLLRLLNDEREGPKVRVLSQQWRPQFNFPRNGPAGLEDTCYYFDYQGVRFLVLNSNEKPAEQAEWLRRVLTENRQRWVIATFHHPFFSAREGRDNAEIRNAWKPVFDEFRVDLVLQGHDHAYGRSGFENLPTGINQAKDDASGTVYVVSVSGPKMYGIEHRPWMVRAAEDTQLFQIITIDGDELRYESRTAVGRLYDAFTLRKREGQANELLEALPPERRRNAVPSP